MTPSKILELTSAKHLLEELAKKDILEKFYTEHFQFCKVLEEVLEESME